MSTLSVNILQDETNDVQFVVSIPRSDESFELRLVAISALVEVLRGEMNRCAISGDGQAEVCSREMVYDYILQASYVHSKKISIN